MSADILLRGSTCLRHGVDDPSDIVIEVDGPSHYLRGDRLCVSGPTRFKHRLLEKSGVKVLHVPYFEWGDLPDSSAKKQYMAAKLYDVGYRNTSIIVSTLYRNLSRSQK